MTDRTDGNRKTLQMAGPRGRKSGGVHAASRHGADTGRRSAGRVSPRAPGHPLPELISSPARSPSLISKSADATPRFQGKADNLAAIIEVAKGFQGQRDDRDCVPVCMKSALDEYYGRMQHPSNPARVALKEINEACGLRGKPGLSTTIGLDQIRDAMASHVAVARVKADYRDGVRADHAGLAGIVKDSAKSYPVLSLGPAYFEDPSVPFRTEAARNPGITQSWFC